ncbi:hypothetical protein AAG906_013942 [Vitis piasezkii]
MAESRDITQPLIPRRIPSSIQLCLMVPGCRDVYLARTSRIYQWRFSSASRNRSFIQEMAHRKRHCQGMVDQFNGPFLDCQFYPIPNCKTDDRLDKTRSDVLQIKPFPTVEQAYAFVRREEVRQTVMISGADTSPGAVMASKGIKGSHHQMPPKPGALSLSSGKSNSSFKTKPPSDGMKCTHCGNTKHTRDTCFKLHGYPDWWNDLQARKKREIIANDNHTGRAAVVTVILLSSFLKPNLHMIPMTLSPFLSLSNTLLVPSHQIDRCLDILTKEIIGRGTKRGGGGYTTWMPSVREEQITCTTRLTQFSARIKILRSDNGGEYVNQQFQTYFNNHGILHETSCSQTPQQNVIFVTTCISNRMPTKVLQFQTPLKVLSYHIYGEERNWSDVEVLEVGENPTHPNDDNDMVEHDPVVEPLRSEPRRILGRCESDVFPHSLVPNDPPPENIPEGGRQWGASGFSLLNIKDGSIDRYKARLVAKGYTKHANLDWPLHQLDVKNAFLHGDLEEEIYMDIPPGYTATSEAKIALARSRQGIFLSQRKYILDLLAEVGLLECKPADIPIVQNHKLGEYVDQVPTDKQRYQRLVGKLIYLSHTRRDIAYASSPGKGLMFSKNGHLKVAGYTDADWAGNITDRKSTAGYFTFVGGNLVTWRSKKQKVVALSSAEAEFRGMVKGISAIAISHNPVQHDRTKHVEVDRNFIKQNLEEKIIQLPFVKSEDQLADVLTKAVSARNFYNSLDKLGIKDIYAPT